MNAIVVTKEAVRQRGLSPKLVVDTVTTVIVFLLATLLPDLDVNDDPIILGVIAKVAGFAAGALVKPGKVDVVN